MADVLLPAAFADLEPFAPTWCLATESERYERRLASSMAAMREFYDAFSTRLPEAIDYCDGFPLDDLPPDVRNLLLLVYSMIMVSMSVEIFHQPKAVNAADAWLLRVREPLP
jgi:hypothetical protein